MAEILNIATHTSMGQQETLMSLLLSLGTGVLDADVAVLALDNDLVIWKVGGVSTQVTDQDDTNGGRHLGQVSMLSMGRGWAVNFGRGAQGPGTWALAAWSNDLYLLGDNGRTHCL